jgi:hypothetical protein
MQAASAVPHIASLQHLQQESRLHPGNVDGERRAPYLRRRRRGTFLNHCFCIYFSVLTVWLQEVFWMLDSLMENYTLTELYRPGFPALKKDFYIHEQLMARYLPRLHAHFRDQCIYSSAYATKVLHSTFSFSSSMQMKKERTDILLTVVPDDLPEPAVSCCGAGVGLRPVRRIPRCILRRHLSSQALTEYIP